MRPIKKGGWPIDKATNSMIIFKDHKEARPYLTQRTGMYCHLCEMKIENVPAIEHIKHQAHSPNLKLHWENFLLICTYCNSRKTKGAIKTYDYYWPHIHNTYLPFDYNSPLVNAGISVNTQLSLKEQSKALATLKLYGLQEEKDSYGSIDNRYQGRREAYSKALNALFEYENELISINAIINLAGAGFWSVWFTVFRNHPEVLSQLLNNFDFRGTEASCFDTNDNYKPMKRTSDM